MAHSYNKWFKGNMTAPVFATTKQTKTPTDGALRLRYQSICTLRAPETGPFYMNGLRPKLWSNFLPTGCFYLKNIRANLGAKALALQTKGKPATTGSYMPVSGGGAAGIIVIIMSWLNKNLPKKVKNFLNIIENTIIIPKRWSVAEDSFRHN
jgi:hypothetical protein